MSDKKQKTFEDIIKMFDPNKHVFYCSQEFFDNLGDGFKEFERYFVIDKHNILEGDSGYMIDKESMKWNPPPLVDIGL